MEILTTGRIVNLTESEKRLVAKLKTDVLWHPINRETLYAKAGNSNFSYMLVDRFLDIGLIAIDKEVGYRCYYLPTEKLKRHWNAK